MADKINKIIFDIDGKEHEFDGGGGGGSAPPPDSVGSEQIIDEETLKRIVREVVDEKEAEGQLTEDDIENIFFPPEVTAITVSGHTIAATAENIDDDEAVTWVLDIDGTESEVDGTGTTLTLDEPMQAAYDAAASVTVRLICSDYESGTYTLKAE